MLKSILAARLVQGKLMKYLLGWMFVVYCTGKSSGVEFRGWRKKNLVAGIRRSGSSVAVSFQHKHKPRVVIYRKGDHWRQLDNYRNRLGGLHAERLCEISMQHG